MYSRELLSPPNKLIVDGKPLFGCYKDLPKSMDIKGVKRPFRVIPLPKFITNLRIRCSISLILNTQEYIGNLYILDAKFFTYSEFILWKKDTKQKFSYRHITGIRRRVIPKNLEKGNCHIRAKKREVHLRWNQEKNLFSLDLYMKGDKYRPSFSANFLINTKSSDFSKVFSVMPAPSTARCTALAQITGPTDGTLFINKNKQYIIPHILTGDMFLNIRRVYAKLRTIHKQITSTGKIGNDRVSVQLGLGSASSIDNIKYNENILFVNGQKTPLPPIVITHPYGINKNWNIQDTENMVDLSFTPISDNLRTLSIFILRSKHHTMYGHLNGVLLTKDGNSITLKNFPAIATLQRIRF